MNLSFASDEGDAFISSLLTSPGMPAAAADVSHSLSSVRAGPLGGIAAVTCHTPFRLNTAQFASNVQAKLDGSFAGPTAAVGAGSSFAGVSGARSAASEAPPASKDLLLTVARQEAEILELKSALDASRSEVEAGTPPGPGLNTPARGQKRRRTSSASGGGLESSPRQAQGLTAALEVSSLQDQVQALRQEVQAGQAEVQEARAAAANARERQARAEAELHRGQQAWDAERSDLLARLREVEAAAAARPEPAAAPAPAPTPPDAALVQLEQRLTSQREKYEGMLSELQGEIKALKEAAAAAAAPPPAATATSPDRGVSADTSSLQAEVVALRRANMTLRRDVAAAQRKARRTRAAADTTDTQHGPAVLREQVASLTGQVARLQEQSQEAARARAALQHATTACSKAARGLEELVAGTQEAAAEATAGLDSEELPGLTAAANAATTALGRAVAEVAAAWSAMQDEGKAAAGALGTLRVKLARAERGASEAEARAAALEGEVAQADAARITAVTSAAAAERRVASLQREVASLEALVSSLQSRSRGKAGAEDDQAVQHLKEQLEAARAELASSAAATSDMAPAAAVSQLQSQVASLKEQVAKSGKALDTALAGQEKLEAENAALRARVGRGEYDTATTKVLHLRANPASQAAQKVKDDAAATVAELQAEVERLRALQLSAGADAAAASGAAGQSTALVPAAELSNAQKRADRLMTVFKKKIKAFRQGVYLITGWKVDMELRPDDSSTFVLRSQFAELEGDSLRFSIDSEETVNLEATPFCPKRVDQRTYAFLQMRGSVPAFVAQLALDLFEKQTLM